MKKLLYTTAAVVAGVMLFSSNVYAGTSKVDQVRYAGRAVADVLSGDMNTYQLKTLLDDAKKNGVPQEDLDRIEAVWADRLNLKNGGNGAAIAELENKIGQWDPKTRGTIAQAITDLQNGQGSVEDLKKAVAAGDAATLAAAKDYSDDALKAAKKYTDDQIASIGGDPSGLADQVNTNKNDIAGLKGNVGEWDKAAHGGKTIAGQVDANTKGIADNAQKIAGLNDALNEGGFVTEADLSAYGTWNTAAHGGNTMAQQVSANTGAIASFGSWNTAAHGGKTMAQQVSSNTDNIGTLQSDVKTLKETTADVSEFKDKLETVQTQTNKNTTDISKLNTTVDSLSTDVNNLTTTVDSHTTAINQLNSTVASQGERLNNVESDVNSINSMLASGEIATNETVTTIVDQKNTVLEQKITEAYTKADAEMEKRITEAYTKADEAIKKGVFIAEGIDKLDTKVNDMNKQMKSSFAAGAAMAALVPNARAEGNTHLAAGTGYYDGKLGAAIGMFHYIDDNVLLNAGLAYAGDDSFTAKGGVTVGF